MSVADNGGYRLPVYEFRRPVEIDSGQVVRHPVVARIVQAYEKFEQQKAAAESKIAGREESSS